MTAHTSINLGGHPHASASVLVVPHAGRFIALRLADAHVSIILDGYDAAAVASARAIINALQIAIAQIEPAPTPTPALSMTYADGAA